MRYKSQDALKFEIAGTCISIRGGRPEIIASLRSFYKDYISDKRPERYLDVEYSQCIKRPDGASLFKTKSWKLSKNGDGYLLYINLNKRNMPSLASFDVRLKRSKFYIQEPFTAHPLLYIFPQVFFSLLMPEKNGLMLHACGVSDGRKGCLFVAPSGGGKSTIAKLALKQGLTLLNDDRIIIRKENSQFKIYGTPWHGEVTVTSNKCLVIHEVFFLQKSSCDRIVPMDRAIAASQFLKNNFTLPADKSIIIKNNKLCFELAEKLRCYSFSFKPTLSLWGVLDDFFKQRSKEK